MRIVVGGAEVGVKTGITVFVGVLVAGMTVGAGAAQDTINNRRMKIL
jgi:hypothetical protein